MIPILLGRGFAQLDNLGVRLFVGAERIKERSLGKPKQAKILISVSKKASSNSIGNHPHWIIRWLLLLAVNFMHQLVLSEPSVLSYIN